MPRTHLLSHWLSCGQTRPQTAGRELVVLDLVVGFEELALLNQVDEIRNLDVDRTSFYTRLILAVQAAVRLVNCGLSIVAEGYFLKVLISYVADPAPESGFS